MACPISLPARIGSHYPVPNELSYLPRARIPERGFLLVLVGV
jgi:hypothetical protein